MWDDPDYYYTPGYERSDDAVLAAQLSWVDAPAARHLVESAFRRLEQSGGRTYFEVGEALQAAAVIDPEWALELVQRFPTDEPPGTEPNRLTRAGAYSTVASTLSRTRAEKRRESFYGFFWMPGPEAD